MFDTNVLISALLSPAGKPRRCLDWAIDHCIILSTEALVEELETRIERPRLAKYADEAARKTFVADFRLHAIMIPVSGSVTGCRDPDDDKVLEVAVVGGAVCIVSGDDDLLVLNPFRGIPILRPAVYAVRTGA